MLNNLFDIDIETSGPTYDSTVRMVKTTRWKRFWNRVDAWGYRMNPEGLTNYDGICMWMFLGIGFKLMFLLFYVGERYL